MVTHLRMSDSDVRGLAMAMDAEVILDFDVLFGPRGRIAPGDPAWIVSSALPARRRRLSSAGFGISRPGRRRLLVNVPADAAAEPGPFHDRLLRQRCLVPVDGLYRWVGARGARRPVLLRRAEGGLFLLHAVYEDQLDAETGECRTAFAVLTTTPPRSSPRAHDRAPAVTLPGSPAAEAWLAASDRDPLPVEHLLSLLLPPPEGLLVDEELPPRRAWAPPIRLARRPPEPEEPGTDRDDGSDPARAARGTQLRLF